MRFDELRPATAQIDWREQDGTLARNIFLACAFVATSSCTTMCAVGSDVWWLGVIGFLASLGVPVAAGLIGFRGRARAHAARFRLDPQSNDLHVQTENGSLILRRPEMRSAFTTGKSGVNVLMNDERSIILDLGSADDAAALVESLGLAKEQAVLEMQLAGRLRSVPAQRFGAFALLPLAAVWLSAACFVGAVLAKVGNTTDNVVFAFGVSILALSLWASLALLFDLRARKVIVGADGVRIPHKKQTIPYADIASVITTDSGVRLVRVGGGYIDLPLFREGAFPFDGFAAARDSLAARINAWRDGSERTAEEMKFNLLERGTQPIAEWKKKLHSLAEPRAGYRVATLNADDLERVISDSAASGEKKVAAAVALSALDRERAITRIRIVVPTCADEDLRRALEHAAEEADFDEEFLAKNRS